MAFKSVKRWIFRKFFSEEFEESKRQGSMDAFKKAREDVEEMIAEKTEDQIKEMAEKKLGDMLSIVDMKNVVTLDKQRGIVYLGGEKADPVVLANLKSEAEFMEKSNLWKILHDTPKELAQRAMFVSGESLADMQKGKSMLYTLAAQKNIIDTFKSYVVKK